LVSIAIGLGESLEHDVGCAVETYLMITQPSKEITAPAAPSRSSARCVRPDTDAMPRRAAELSVA
jgi:hypothetical protein